MEVSRELNESMNGNFLDQCLAQSNRYLNMVGAAADGSSEATEEAEATEVEPT